MVQLNRAFWIDDQIWDAFKDVPGPKGRTRLMFASMHGDLDRVKRLLARGAQVNTCLASVGSILMMASVFGHLEIVQELCKKGALVNVATITDGPSALLVACENGHLKIVNELCKRGANVTLAPVRLVYGHVAGATTHLWVGFGSPWGCGAWSHQAADWHPLCAVCTCCQGGCSLKARGSSGEPRIFKGTLSSSSQFHTLHPFCGAVCYSNCNCKPSS